VLPANANAKHEAAAAAASSTPLQQQKWADFALLLMRAIAFFATCNCGRHAYAYILVWGIFCTLYGGATAASASMSYLFTARISAICNLQMGVNWWTTF
jgi:hypothetical protein